MCSHPERVSERRPICEAMGAMSDPPSEVQFSMFSSVSDVVLVRYCINVPVRDGHSERKSEESLLKHERNSRDLSESSLFCDVSNEVMFVSFDRADSPEPVILEHLEMTRVWRLVKLARCTRPLLVT